MNSIIFNMFKPAPVKPMISFKEFSKLDIRVGTIQLVEDIPKSENLVKLIVDFGDHRRNILVGMKKELENSSKSIVGTQTLFVVNLEPRKMMGVLSEGMLFDIGYADKLTPVLAIPEKPVPDGTRVG
jgi:methionine--tRNA ligase beta chain